MRAIAHDYRSCTSVTSEGSGDEIGFRQSGSRFSLISDFTIRRRDGNENFKNNQTIGLEGKTTILLAHCTFLYIFLPFLHHRDLKLPNLTLHGGRKQATTIFLNLDIGNSTPGGFTYF